MNYLVSYWTWTLENFWTQPCVKVLKVIYPRKNYFLRTKHSENQIMTNLIVDIYALKLFRLNKK